MKILFVTPSLPSLPKGGSDRRMHGLISGVAASHIVSLLALVRPGTDHSVAIEAARAYCKEVVTVENDRAGLSHARKRGLQLGSLVSSRSYERLVYQRPALQDALDCMLARTRYDMINVEQCWMAYSRFPHGAKLVLDEHNIEYDILRRTFRVGSDPARRFYNYIDFLKLRREEQAIWRKVNACTLTSDRDERLLRRDLPVVKSVVVPNGTDTDYFRPRNGTTEPRTIVFFGNLDYYPNLDGLLFFLREVMPRLKRSHPQVKLLIVGLSSPGALSAWTSNDVIVTGVVDDVRPYLERASVVIAPLRIGGGTRLKILEAMAMRKPVVSTRLGSEGIDVTDGHDILLADTGEEFAARVGLLLDDATLAHRLGTAGRALVERCYDWRASVKRLEGLYQELLSEDLGAAQATRRGAVFDRR